MILDEYFPDAEAVGGIEMPDALVDKRACALAHAQILLPIPSPQYHVYPCAATCGLKGLRLLVSAEAMMRFTRFSRVAGCTPRSIQR